LGRFSTAAFMCVVLATPVATRAQDALPATISDADRRRITLVRVDGGISLDGRLDESVWQGPSQSGFVQAEPREGQPATEQTEVWLAYDESNLYVAARLHDTRAPVVSDSHRPDAYAMTAFAPSSFSFSTVYWATLPDPDTVAILPLGLSPRAAIISTAK